MKAFIVDATYRAVDGRSFVCLFCRGEDGEAFVTMNAFKPYFFIREKDLKKAERIENFAFEKTSLKTFYEELVVKILADVPGDVPQLRRAFEEEGILTYEADIVFPRRFLIDHTIKAYVEVNGDYEFQDEIRVYTDPEIIPISSLPIPLKVMAIDIETDPRARKMYSIAIACATYKKVLIVSKEKLTSAETFATEEEMLKCFFTLVKEVDPDIITGWNVIDFDFQVIKKRCKKFNIPFVLGRVAKESKLVLREGFFERSKISAEGRIIIDLLDWIRGAVKLSNYRLETAAQHYLKEGKVKLQNGVIDIERFFHEEPEKLVVYNLKDAVLVLQILDTSNILPLYVRRSELTGLMIDEVRGSIASLDSIYLKHLRKRGYVAPSVKYTEKEESITGGYVMDSKPGIYDNIVVFDFKSLYPSLMRTFNIDPLSYGKKGITAPNGATFSKEFGIMPEILKELMEVREEYRKKKDEVGRYAIKILLNSFFGVMASPVCRFYNLEMANAITSFAQFFIKKTAKLIEDDGYEVIYSDTDSVFIVAGNKPENVGKTIEKKVNATLNDFVKKEYGVPSYLELEFEKVYSKFLMPHLRGVAKGAKKRYAGLVDGHLEITGLEAVRGDWTPLAKKFQEELLLRVFSGEEVAPFVSSFLSNLKAGKYDDLLVYKKSVRKPLEEYVKINPPHIKAARKLKEFSGSVIQYVYTKEGIEPLELAHGNYDYEHYIQKQLKPIANSILVFFKLNFEELLSGQKTLFSY